MHILVIGATGGTGRTYVEQALAAGHRVSVLVRSPQKLQGAAELTVTTGDGQDPAAVRRAFGADPFDAVAILVGGGLSADTTNEDITRNVIDAARESGQRPHLWILSACGTGDSYSQTSWIARLLMRTLLRHPFADHQRQETLVRSCGLPYTIVRPVGLTNGPLTPDGYVARSSGKLPSNRISRANVAHYMVSKLGNPKVESLGVALSGK
ncbi:NAD(P)-dependent oxidoreductase [Lewinella sp. IMCC34183]|uniref:NAD(P)-dependent oxidoreductase n=1 Tax=Lewinella sp. IMCC34183 TaxID=2248762 RepID=UPI000E252B22|nr:NAD(P)-binding oxidoreductase [Lewinella sp. IMCC34183]